MDARGLAEELIRLGENATPGRWYVLGPPWAQSDDGYVLAGSDDPHLAAYVCDTMVLSDEEDWRESENSTCDAQYIAFANPENTRAVSKAYLDLLEAVRDYERQRHGGKVTYTATETEARMYRLARVQGDFGMRLEDTLQAYEYSGTLATGYRFAFGHWNYRVEEIKDPGFWGHGYLDVTLVIENTGSKSTKVVSKRSA